MPNWTTNEVEVKGSREAIAEMISQVGTYNKELDRNDFDFNKLIPMPKELNVLTGGCDNDDIIAYLTTFNLPVPKNLVVYRNSSYKADIEHGKQLWENYTKYGYTSWYKWCSDKWGTKWNACDTAHFNTESIVEDTDFYSLAFAFDTAWDTPRPIWDKLADRFPSLYIEVTATFEGGENTEQMIYANGEKASHFEFPMCYEDNEGNRYDDYDEVPENKQDEVEYVADFDNPIIVN